MARDGEHILPQARTQLLELGAETPLAVVLLHGLTNNPAQYARFAPLLNEHGVNVFVPRFPRHGHRDRLTTRTVEVTAEMLLDATAEAVDIGWGLGSRVAVLGISLGGILAAHVAQFRAIDRAVPIAPIFALPHLPYWLSRLVQRIALTLPNAFLWWDPRVRADAPPPTAYPRFSTRALAQMLRIGDAVDAAARTSAPLAAHIVTLVNRDDPAVNNAVTKHISELWSRRKPAGVEYIELIDLPTLHDIIDPGQPQECTELVYPKLLRVLGVEPTS
ncbi:MAG: alpha/beta fold hydrolase [Candidatus Cybelea sp.]